MVEVLLYLSLTLDAVSVAFQDRTPTAKVTAQMISTPELAQWRPWPDPAFGLFFVRRRRGPRWPRWVLIAQRLVLSVISLVQLIGEKGLRFGSGIEVISCALTAMGLYYASYLATRWGWFQRLSVMGKAQLRAVPCAPSVTWLLIAGGHAALCPPMRRNPVNSRHGMDN